jgi:hypothetical protein
MSNSEEITRPIPDLTGFPTFIYVIDGEVVDVQVISPIDERKIAVLSSSPQIYVLDGGFPANGVPPRIGSPWRLG